MKIKLLLLALALSVPVWAQHTFPALDTNNVWTGQNNLPVSYTVAKLPVSPADGTTAIVTDGNGVSCTSGGSTTLVLCRYSAAAGVWQVIGGGGGGGAVSSIFGRVGVVTAQTGDYSVTQVTGAAPLASPNFTGTPTAPTQATGDNSTALATDAYVKANLASYLTSAYQTIAVGAAGLTSRPTLNFIQGTGMTISCVDNSGASRTDCTLTASGTGAISSVFGRTGAISAQSGDYTVSQITGAAPLASPTFTGTPTSVTPSTADNSTAIATTAYVKNNLASYLTGAYQTVDSNGTGVTQRAAVNFIQGPNMTVNCVDNAVSLRTDCTFTGAAGGGAGNPGGSPGQLQFNNSSVFGGITGTSVSGANITVAGSFVISPTAAYTAGALQVSPSDLTTPTAVFNAPSGSTADIADFNTAGVKQFFLDANGKANFQTPSVTSASFNMPFGAAPTSCNGTGVVGCPGDLYTLSPSTIEFVDANGTQQDIAANNISNVFNKVNTFIAPDVSHQAVVMRSAGTSTTNTADVFQVQDNTGTAQIEFTKDFGVIANYFKTNGVQAGLQEFTSTSTDPVAIPVDANSFRLEAAVSSTHQTRFVLPTQASTAAATQVLLSDNCPNDANGVPKCTSSIGQVPNAALVNSSLTINGSTFTLGASGNQGQLNDSNGNPEIESVATASANSFLTVTNGSTATPVITLTAAGTPSNLSINLVSKGTGTVQCNGSPCGGGGGGGNQVSVNGSPLTGSTANLETAKSLIGTPSTQAAAATNNGDAMGVQFAADSSTPSTNVIGYVPGVMPMPHYRRMGWIQATGSTISNMGDVQATSGSVSHPAASSTDPVMDNFATTTTSGSNASISGNLIFRTGRNIRFQTYSELTDEASGSQRAWWGVSSGSAATMLASDMATTTTVSFAAFRYSTVATDTTFKCVVGNGSATTVKDTGVAADANGHYFDIVFDDTTGNIQCLIDGVVKATFANTDNVPAAATNLGQFVAIQTEAAATRDIREAWMLTTSDK